MPRLPVVSRKPITVPLTPQFLHFAKTVDASGIVVPRVAIVEAAFLAPGTITVSRQPEGYRVLVPVGFKSPVPYPKLIVAAYRHKAKKIYTIQDEVAALRQVVLDAHQRASVCPFCVFSPCIDTCIVQKIKRGDWISPMRAW